ncbi:MAG TPA: hypothetical protein VN704_05565 [Verrucomicrobiae bacterium]|nr:hypothetical protein [Verrucomicrobiae bacterium]
MVQQIRKRTEPEDILYSLHLYFLVFLRNTSKAISRFVKRSHTAIRDWIQKYKPERLFHIKTKTSEFIMVKQFKVGSDIEFENKDIPAIDMFKERNMLVAERLISNILDKYGQHPVSTDSGT